MIPSGQDLLDMGYVSGKVLGDALRYAQQRGREGAGWDTIRTELEVKFPRARAEKLRLRDKDLSINYACRPDTDEEHSNLETSLVKIGQLSRVPVVESVALMPDNCPAGQEWGSMPVGSALVTKHHILPAAHSSDINCGMHASFFLMPSSRVDVAGVLRDNCLFGPWGAPEEAMVDHEVLRENVWSNPFLSGLEDAARNYLGTQGDGNHFTYFGSMVVRKSLLDKLDKNGHGDLAEKLKGYSEDQLGVIVTHHGSRQLGAKLYKRGIEYAFKETSKIADGIPKNGSWIDIRTEQGQYYWQALKYVGRWTEANHHIVHERLLQKIGVSKVASIANHHNAIWEHDGHLYHGKGATPAWRDGEVPRLGIIPLNMGREILVVLGKDNHDFLSFAPHGAGRNKSRSALKKEFSESGTNVPDNDKILRELTRLMGDIPVVWASGQPDISESPIGYKSASKIKKELVEFGLAELLGEIDPKGCIMAGEFDKPNWKKLLKKKDFLSVGTEKSRVI
jgi:tRNA-splicing ligase RtcB